MIFIPYHSMIQFLLLHYMFPVIFPIRIYVYNFPKSQKITIKVLTPLHPPNKNAPTPHRPG